MRTDTFQLMLGKTSPTICIEKRELSWIKSNAHVISRTMKIILYIMCFKVAGTVVFIVFWTPGMNSSQVFDSQFCEIVSCSINSITLDLYELSA